MKTLIVAAWLITSACAPVPTPASEPARTGWIMWSGRATGAWMPERGYSTEDACKKDAEKNNRDLGNKYEYHTQFTCFPETFAPPTPQGRP